MKVPVSPTARYLLWSGSLLYLLGVIGVTALFNIPLNDTLAHMGADSIEASAFWHRYLAAWTIWNHVRAAAALAGTAAFLFASMALTRCGL